MSVRVSVVVAVYNTGEHIQPLIESLGRQTLRTDEFEVIFVDDGSTDETPAVLDRLAASRPNVFVLHEPNSGWPGRPRNVGMDRAVGKYVFFVDHDDWLGDEALARMADYGDEHASDIVIGRYAGHHRGVAKALFERSRPDASLANAPLMDSLTPHKMFRAQFLRDHAIRFPEGRRRLEDHVFVVRAYFLARRIAVLADYHCYFHIGRQDAGNAGYQRIEPVSYYGYVREVIEIINTYTEAGSPLRTRCLRRPLRQEILARLDGQAFLAQDAGYQRQLFDAARELALSAIPAEVDAGLSPPQQVRAYLLRKGRFEDLIEYLRHQVGVRVSVELTGLRWRPGELVIDFDARLVDSTGEPWTYRHNGSGTFLTVPAMSVAVPDSSLGCAAQLDSARVRLVARRRADSEEWPVTTESISTLHSQSVARWLEFRGSAKVNPLLLGGGRPLTSGVWDIYAVVSQTGWSKQARLGAARTESASEGCRPAVVGRTAIVPYWTKPYGNLSLDVGASRKTLISRAGPTVDDCSIITGPEGATLQIRVRVIAATAERTNATVRLQQLSHAKVRELPATTDLDDAGLMVSAQLPRLHGRWALLVQPGLAAWGPPYRTDAVVSFGRSGRATVGALIDMSTARRGAGAVGKVRRFAHRTLRGARRRLGAHISR